MHQLSCKKAAALLLRRELQYADPVRIDWFSSRGIETSATINSNGRTIAKLYCESTYATVIWPNVAANDWHHRLFDYSNQQFDNEIREFINTLIAK